MIDLDPRQKVLEVRLKDLTAAYQQAQQQSQVLQVEIWKTQGKLELLRDLKVEADGMPAVEVT